MLLKIDLNLDNLDELDLYDLAVESFERLTEEHKQCFIIRRANHIDDALRRKLYEEVEQ